MALTLMEYEKACGYRKDKFSPFLPYEGYDPESGFFVSLNEIDPYVGVIFECDPVTFGSEDQFKTIEHILEIPFPKNSFLQFILCADPRIDLYLEYFLNLRRRRPDKRIGEILLEEGVINESQLHQALEIQQKTGKKLGEILISEGFTDLFTLKRALKNQTPISIRWAEKYAEFLRNHTEKGFYEDIPVPIRDFRLYVALKIPFDPDEEDLQDVIRKSEGLVRDIESNLKTSYFSPRLLDPQGILDAFYWFFNPGVEGKVEYDEQVPIKQQMISPNSYYRWEPGYGKCKFRINDHALTVMSVNKYPKEVCPLDTLPLVGDYMNRNLKQILCPFILTLNVFFKKADTSVLLWAEKMFSQKMTGSGGFKLRAKQKEAERAVATMEEEKQSFYYFSYSLVLYSKPNLRDRDAGHVRAIWKKQGFDLIEESVYPIATFLFSIPLGPKLNPKTQRYIRDRFRVAPVKSIKDLAPIQGEWKGAGRPVLLFVSRRGQLVSFDFFTGSNANYNAVIYAQSRAGKSFFTNFITTCYHGIGAQIWIIDIGRSYEKLCHYLGGEFISLSKKKDICLNPFSYTQRGEDEESSLELIAYLVARMAKPEHGCDEEELNFIKEAVIAAWEKYENEATITNVADFLSRRGKEKAHRLADLLVDYTHGGTYSSLFDGPANVDLSGRNLLVLELEEFSKTPALRSVVLALVMYQIQEACYLGDRSIPKLVMIDEAWQFFEDNDRMIARFIEHGFRRMAKYGGAFVVITQGLEDFYLKSDKVGQAIISNSAHHIILKQDPSVIEHLVAEKKLDVPGFYKEYMKSVHTIKGKYSEFLIRTEGFYGGISRLFVDDFSFALFNTDSEKVAFINSLLDRGYSLEEALEEAIRTNYGGMATDNVKRAENEAMRIQSELIQFIKSADPRILPELRKIFLTNGMILEDIAGMR